MNFFDHKTIDMEARAAFKGVMDYAYLANERELYEKLLDAKNDIDDATAELHFAYQKLYRVSRKLDVLVCHQLSRVPPQMASKLKTLARCIIDEGERPPEEV